ncbi:MAG: translesion DNA synthesis-associated protein ImuA [Burkholderiales bacterium]|nr:translesion DNA synthesis-associated protein ImuA [Burkholderiales bacterium]
MGHALPPPAASLPAARPPARPGDAGAGLAALPGLWRGRDLARAPSPGFPTGFAPLDAELPGGGWPAGALTEVLCGQAGIGEVRLFFPALSALARGDAPVFLLEPPWLPYAPAFAGGGIPAARLVVVRPRRPADAMWACEQILRGLTGGALLAWPRHLRAQDIRRLQLAVEGKPVLAVLMRPPAAAGEPTPAALRIALEAAPPAHLALRILKRRGGMLARTLRIAPPSPLFTSLPAQDAPVCHAVDRDSSRLPDARLHPASA